MPEVATSEVILKAKVMARGKIRLTAVYGEYPSLTTSLLRLCVQNNRSSVFIRSTKMTLYLGCLCANALTVVFVRMAIQ